MQRYNNPAGGVQSSIEAAGNTQMNVFYWQRRALIEAAKEMFFSPMADTTSMPKGFGKEIRVHHYIPLLDDRNVNDQGINAAGATIVDGNLYGSSKDIGTIVGKLPTLTESGGRVNRVGFTRLVLTGSIHRFGIFTEFSQEALDFDSDQDLYQHISREMVTGATQLTEAVLQKDLLAAAGVVVYAGSATANNQITGEGPVVSEVNYRLLMRLNRILNDNRTPKQTKVITGSKMVDTKTISNGRVLYIGSELEITVKGMTDLFGNPAFIPVHQYADAGTVLNGEIGTVDAFRIVVVPEMLHWAGVGANVVSNPGFEATAGRYDVFPMLCVGDGAFTTIGFQSGGKMMKFVITTKMPGRETADRNDPYGEMGFSSIKWYYGFMGLRTERLAVVKTVARI
jgi:N4-gp56 family major capsid protein